MNLSFHRLNPLDAWIAISLGLLSVYLKSLPGPVQDVGLLNGSVNWSGLYDIT